jgi:hypothetical protein
MKDKKTMIGKMRQVKLVSWVGIILRNYIGDKTR